MTMYAPNDMQSVLIPAEGHGGCGETHRRDGAVPWGVSCEPCEAWLRARDDRWAPTIAEIRETFDEAKARERFEVTGAADQSALMTAAIARLAGFSRAEIPETLSRKLAGIGHHVPVAGKMVCAGCGAAQPPGQKFCGDCGQAMASRVPAAAVTAGAAA